MTIKETAGKILLYFYQLQRTVPSNMRNRQLGFIDKSNGGVSLTSDKKWLTKDLLAVNPASTDVFNAYMFLLNKGYIHARERSITGAQIYVGTQVTETGIDMIESIESGDQGKEAFNSAFNIRVDDSTDVDALIKENLSTLLS